MRRERCSYRAALELLLKDAPSLAAPLEAAAPRTTSAKLEEIAKPEEPEAWCCGAWWTSTMRR